MFYMGFFQKIKNKSIESKKFKSFLQKSNDIVDLKFISEKHNPNIQNNNTKRLMRFSDLLNIDYERSVSAPGLIKKYIKQIYKISEHEDISNDNLINEYNKLYPIALSRLVEWNADSLKVQGGKRMLYSSKEGRDIAFTILTQLLYDGFYFERTQNNYNDDLLDLAMNKYAKKVLKLLPPEYWLKAELQLNDFFQFDQKLAKKVQNSFYEALTPEQEAMYIEYLLKNKAELSPMLALSQKQNKKNAIIENLSLTKYDLEKMEEIRLHIQLKQNNNLILKTKNENEVLNKKLLNAKVTKKQEYYHTINENNDLIAMLNIKNEKINKKLNVLNESIVLKINRQKIEFDCSLTDYIVSKYACEKLNNKDRNIIDVDFTINKLWEQSYESVIYPKIADFSYRSGRPLDVRKDKLIIEQSMSNALYKLTCELQGVQGYESNLDVLTKKYSRLYKKADNDITRTKCFFSNYYKNLTQLAEKQKKIENITSTTNKKMNDFLATKSEKEVSSIFSKLQTKIKNTKSQRDILNEDLRKINRDFYNIEMESQITSSNKITKKILNTLNEKTNMINREGSIFDIIRTYESVKDNVEFESIAKELKNLAIKKIKVFQPKDYATTHFYTDNEKRELFAERNKFTHVTDRVIKNEYVFCTALGKENKMRFDRAQAVKFVLDNCNMKDCIEFSKNITEIPAYLLLSKIGDAKDNELYEVYMQQKVFIYDHIKEILGKATYENEDKKKIYKDFFADYDKMLDAFQAPPLRQIYHILKDVNNNKKSINKYAEKYRIGQRFDNWESADLCIAKKLVKEELFIQNQNNTK